MLQDNIADMLTIIRNAQAKGHKKVRVSYSKFKDGICKILLKEGYIEDLKIRTYENSVKKDLEIHLKYFQGKGVIEEIKKVSKLSLRVYSSYKKLMKHKLGLGTVILSTSRGIITDKEARTNKVGGEVICIVF